MSTIINALLPVFVTLLIGYFAAWHHDEDGAAATSLNKMVMTYTLPLSLFAGTVVMSSSDLLANLPMVAALFAGLAIPFAVVLISARYIFHRGLGESTLQALAISFPAVPFIGIPVLGSIFGAEAATLTVAISGLATNLIIVPGSIVLLSIATTSASKDGKTASHPPACTGTQGRDDQSKQEVANKPAVGSIILSSLKEPVVWAPVLAVVLVFAGLSLPKQFVSPLQLLGSTTSGVSLFASGIILRSQTPTLSIPIVTSTVGRLAVVPAAAFFLLPLVGITGKPMSESVVALAMPSAVMLIILSVQYRVAEKESASVLLYSYVFSALSMAAAVLLTK